MLFFWEEGMRKKRSGASDYWEDKGPAVRAVTAPSTSGAPPSLPSELPIQFHPHKGISSTAPSLIYPSIHLSLPQQMGKITCNNATTNCPRSPPPQSYIQISAPLKLVPAVEKDTSESLKECKWWPFAAREFRTVQMSDLVSAGFALRQINQTILANTRQLEIKQEFRRVHMFTWGGLDLNILHRDLWDIKLSVYFRVLSPFCSLKPNLSCNSLFVLCSVL